MDWETLYCPNPVCPFYSVRFRKSRLVKNGTTRGQRQAWCRACRSSVALTYGTPSFDLEHDPALFELAIRALAEGIRSGRRRGSSKLIRIPYVLGSIVLPSIVGSSGFLCGNSCPSERASWTNYGALSRRKTSISPGRKPTVTRLAMPGFGWPLPQNGASSWPLSSASARKLKPICCWSGSPTLPRTSSPFLPVINCQNIVPPCCMSMENGISHHGVECEVHPLIRNAFPPESCAMPKWSRRANGVAWWQSTTPSCVEMPTALPRSWPRYRRVRPSIPALSTESIWRFANTIGA